MIKNSLVLKNQSSTTPQSIKIILYLYKRHIDEKKMDDSRDKNKQTQYKIISIFSLMMICIGIIALLFSSNYQSHPISYTILAVGVGTGFYGLIGWYNEYSD